MRLAGSAAPPTIEPIHAHPAPLWTSARRYGQTPEWI
jgi:hypothetical protein